MTRTGSRCTDVENQSTLYPLEPLLLERVLQQRDELWQMQNPSPSLKLSPLLKISPSLIEGRSRHRMRQVSLGTGRKLQPAEPCLGLPPWSSWGRRSQGGSTAHPVPRAEPRAAQPACQADHSSAFPGLNISTPMISLPLPLPEAAQLGVGKRQGRVRLPGSG